MAAVIGSEYCNDNATDIGVLMAVLPINKNHFVVTDINNNIIFRVDDISGAFHFQRQLLDANAIPIATFRHKVMSMHHRWEAFKGDSMDKKDLIFCTKESSSIHSNSDTNVYLAGNKDEKICDYRVDSSFVFYSGCSEDNIIAKAQEHMVAISPNVDIAFIVSLIVIVDGVSEVRAANQKIKQTLLKGGAKAAN